MIRKIVLSILKLRIRSYAQVAAGFRASLESRFGVLAFQADDTGEWVWSW